MYLAKPIMSSTRITQLDNEVITKIVFKKCRNTNCFKHTMAALLM